MSAIDRARLGAYAAYLALAIVVGALPLVGSSESVCRFVGSATQDSAGSIGEPGHTAGVLAFTLAPLLALGVLLARRRGMSRGTLVVAAAVFPLAVLNFVIWAARGIFACGLPLL